MPCTSSRAKRSRPTSRWCNGCSAGWMSARARAASSTQTGAACGMGCCVRIGTESDDMANASRRRAVSGEMKISSSVSGGVVAPGAERWRIRWQLLYFSPLPHQHSSLRPNSLNGLTARARRRGSWRLPRLDTKVTSSRYPARYPARASRSGSVKAGWIVARAVDGAAVVIGHLPAGLGPELGQPRLPAVKRKLNVSRPAGSRYVTDEQVPVNSSSRENAPYRRICVSQMFPREAWRREPNSLLCTCKANRQPCHCVGLNRPPDPLVGGLTRRHPPVEDSGW
jgi:hypothetical protein